MSPNGNRALAGAVDSVGSNISAAEFNDLTHSLQGNVGAAEHPCICEQCHTAISPGPFKPRRFCSDSCRKKSKRTKKPPGVPEVGSAKNNAPAVKSAELRPKFSNKINGRVSGQHGPSATSERALNLVGGWRTPAVLNPDLARKILAAEVGIPADTRTSTDGVRFSVIPRRRL